MPYITPSSVPPTTYCRRLLIPDDPYWIGIVTGALLELVQVWNWEQTDGITVEAAVEAAQAMIESYYEECPMTEELPIGSILPNIAVITSEKWVFCQGQNLLRSAYPELYDAVNPTWRVVIGGIQYTQLPNFSKRAVIQIDTSGANPQYIEGALIGAETHTLTIAQMPQHTHVQELITPAPSARPITGQGSGTEYVNTQNTQATGGGQAHNNMQPSIALRWYCKVKP